MRYTKSWVARRRLVLVKAPVDIKQNRKVYNGKKGQEKRLKLISTPRLGKVTPTSTRRTVEKGSVPLKKV
jgi:hypothetical protein